MYSWVITTVITDVAMVTVSRYRFPSWWCSSVWRCRALRLVFHLSAGGQRTDRPTESLDSFRRPACVFPFLRPTTSIKMERSQSLLKFGSALAARRRQIAFLKFISVFLNQQPLKKRREGGKKAFVMNDKAGKLNVLECLAFVLKA